MIRESTRGYAERDEISEALGDVRYAQNWYPPGLKQSTVGPHSFDMVSVSRHYFLLKPAVIVDFEPSPLDAKMWLDEKRKWCFEQGIMYIPIMLGERLSGEQFKARVEEERAFLLSGRRHSRDLAAMAAVLPIEVLQNLPQDRTVEDVLTHPAAIKWIDDETMRRFNTQHGTRRELRGAARSTVIERIKRTVIEDVRERVKHGRMGSVLGDQQPAVAAR